MKTVLIPKSRAQFLRFLKEALAEAGIAEAREESERILEEVLGLTRTGLYLDPEKEVPEEAVERSLKLLEGRKKRIPLAYLFKKAHFRNETFFVNEQVLIPRPETEVLVDAVIRSLRGRAPFSAIQKKVPDPLSFLDVGTGSGAIAISLLREFPDAHGALLDVSPGALEVARKNVENYGLQGRTRFTQGDLLAAFGPDEKWDLIVSNPPYLSEADFKAVEPELGFEPRQALDGGKDGFDFYRRIIPEARHHLRPGGFLAFEVGAGQAGSPMGPARSRGLDAPFSQAAQVSTWLQEAGYVNIQRFKDYLGVERVVISQRGLAPF